MLTEKVDGQFLELLKDLVAHGPDHQVAYPGHDVDPSHDGECIEGIQADIDHHHLGQVARSLVPDRDVKDLGDDPRSRQVDEGGDGHDQGRCSDPPPIGLQVGEQPPRNLGIVFLVPVLLFEHIRLSFLGHLNLLARSRLAYLGRLPIACRRS